MVFLVKSKYLLWFAHLLWLRCPKVNPDLLEWSLFAKSVGTKSSKSVWLLFWLTVAPPTAILSMVEKLFNFCLSKFFRFNFIKLDDILVEQSWFSANSWLKHTTTFECCNTVLCSKLVVGLYQGQLRPRHAALLAAIAATVHRGAKCHFSVQEILSTGIK